MHREVLALGTPLLWWAACFAIVYVLWRWAFRRDWRAGAIACGIAAGYLPLVHAQERTISSSTPSSSSRSCAWRSP